MCDKFDRYMSLEEIKRRLQLWRVRQFVFARKVQVIYCVDIENLHRSDPKVDGFEFFFGTEADLALLDTPNLDYDKPSLRYAAKRLKAGDRLILGRHEGRIVFYVWFCLGKMELIQGHFVDIAPDSAFTYKGFVHGDYRGKGIMPGSYKFLCSYLAENGYRKVLTLISVDNIASRNYSKKVGFEERGTVTHWRVLGLRYNSLSAEARQLINAR